MTVQLPPEVERAVTERGRATLAKAFPLWEQAQGRIKGGLGPERFQALLAELSAVVALARGR